MRKRLSNRVVLFGCVNVAFLGASAVGAQEAAEDKNLEEIVVTATGTHISGFDAPTPLTMLSQEELKSKAVDRISDLIVDVPQLAANQNFGRTSVAIGASNFDLRGLGPTRTLLLLDGRRVAPTEPTGTIDTNIIPTSLIKGMDIVTGGASAAYGSDAVSGVVNITLDDRFEGFKTDLQYGISTYGDVQAPAASVTLGHAFADNRLHVVGALDYYDNHGQLYQDSRPWGRNNYALITNPNGPPNRLEAANTRYSQLTDGGVAALNNIAALKGIQFGPGGTVLPFNYGTSVGTQFMIGGDGGTMGGSANILPELQRKSAFTRIGYDITDKVSIFADALFANIDAFSDSAFVATNRAPLAININNAFLPAQVRNTMAANKVTTFYLGRIIEEEGRSNTSVDNKVQRYGVGLKGEFASTWHWDVAAQFGKTNYYRDDGNNQNTRRFGLGVDSVINPANGQPICRSLLNAPNSTDPDIAHCVPINVFGAGSISPAALAYFTGDGLLSSEQKQSLAGGNIDGKPFSTWAGDVSVAVGAEYRKDEIHASSDAVSQNSGWFNVNSKPLSGSVNVKEAYTEVDIPLLKQLPFGYAMDVDGAIRYTDYSISGAVTTWKAGINYSPVADVRLRATLSRDIRAPSVNELYSGQSQFVTNLIDPRNNSNPVVPLLTGGNLNLTPETSRAWTAGIVYQPSWFDGFRASIDYYHFNITNAITTLSGQQIIDGCFKLHQTGLCDQITQNAAGAITAVSGTLLNAAASATDGFDTEIGYMKPALGGKFDFRLLSTFVNELTTTINGVTTDTVNQLGSESAGGIPKWRAVGSVHFIHPSFTAGVLVRYVDHGLFNTTYVQGVDINNNHIASRTYVDLDLAKNVGEHFELYAKINNVFNVFPPLAPNQITEPNYNGGSFQDRIGRYFKVGVRAQF
jgi:iron complex outermembrane receptor protein